MSNQILCLMAPAHYDNVAAIAGSEAALLQLKALVEDALRSGSGGAYLSRSGGQGYSLAIVRVDGDPQNFGDVGNRMAHRPIEGTLCIRANPHFTDALRKARPPVLSQLVIPRFIDSIGRA